MNASNIKNILEAALMVATQPLTLDKLQGLFARDAVQPDRDVLRSVLNELIEDCNGRGIELKEVASGWRYQVKPDYAEWVNRLWDEKPTRYSRALMETLAIIAYRQPITRGEIEDIRGVAVSTNIIRTLQEREWIKSVGHRDVPGKPELLATTKEFLDYFNLKKLSDLPTLAEIRDLDDINPDLFADLNKVDTEQQTPAETSDNPPATDNEAMVAEETAAADEDATASAQDEKGVQQEHSDESEIMAESDDIQADVNTAIEDEMNIDPNDGEDDDDHKVVQFSK